MPTMWNEAHRRGLLSRLGALRADTKPAWGKMNCAEMLAHLNESMKMALGDLRPKLKNTRLSRFPLKQLVLYVLPWPKGVPTSPELLARGDGAGFDAERALLPSLVERLVGRRGAPGWPVHPAFGVLSERAWGFLVWRHMDHHLRQFGA